MFTIVIPSYNRADLLLETTFKYLVKVIKDLSKVNIDILVNDNISIEHLNKYLMYFPYNDHLHLRQMPPNVKSIGGVRNWIRQTYTGNVLMMDDDITGIHHKCNDKETKELMDDNNFITWVNDAFTRTLASGASMWGVQLFDNPFFLRGNEWTITTKLSYVNGSFTGIILPDAQDIRTDIDHFEDYLFSILHWLKDGVVVKYSGVCLKTKPFNTDGGICEQKGGMGSRREEAFFNSKMLHLWFPELLSVKYSKKYKIDNIRLNTQAKWSSDLSSRGGLYLTR